MLTASLTMLTASLTMLTASLTMLTASLTMLTTSFTHCPTLTLPHLMEQVPGIRGVAFPDHIGCGLAGGDWQRYHSMISQFAACNPQLEVCIYQLDSEHAAVAVQACASLKPVLVPAWPSRAHKTTPAARAPQQTSEAANLQRNMHAATRPVVNGKRKASSRASGEANIGGRIVKRPVRATPCSR